MKEYIEDYIRLVYPTIKMIRYSEQAKMMLENNRLYAIRIVKEAYKDNLIYMVRIEHSYCIEQNNNDYPLEYIKKVLDDSLCTIS